jgi:ABC-type long-subunit fatty acid transport system fused permease/ATPase subunit
MFKSHLTKSKNVFLLDSLGALLTTILLFFILRNFNAFFGLPKYVFEYLSIIALLFFIYSISCYFIVKQNWKSFLKIICTANILYCLLTSGIILYNYETISVYGIVYFLAEIAVIIGLVALEMKIIKSKS